MQLSIRAIRSDGAWSDTKEISDFINFELSPEGQKIFEEMGYLPVSEEYKKKNTEMLTKSWKDKFTKKCYHETF